MSQGETTPKKVRRQSSLEWSFKKGRSREKVEEDPEKEADPGTEKWPLTPSPFKKVKSRSNPEQWKAFTKDLETTRLMRIQEAKDRTFIKCWFSLTGPQVVKH